LLESLESLKKFPKIINCYSFVRWSPHRNFTKKPSKYLSSRIIISKPYQQHRKLNLLRAVIILHVNQGNSHSVHILKHKFIENLILERPSCHVHAWHSGIVNLIILPPLPPPAYCTPPFWVGLERFSSGQGHACGAVTKCEWMNERTSDVIIASLILEQYQRLQCYRQPAACSSGIIGQCITGYLDFLILPWECTQRNHMAIFRMKASCRH